MPSMWFFCRMLVVEETVEDTVAMYMSILIKDVQINVPVFQALERGCTQFLV